MTWHNIILSINHLSAKEDQKIVNFFASLIRAVKDGDSRGIAVFDIDFPDHLVMYFTPKAYELCKEVLDFYDAVPCDAPIDDGKIIFRIGDDNMWRYLRKQD